MINRFINLIHERWVRGLFAGSILENLIPPIPSELIMPRWWYLASLWKINIFVAIFVGAFWSTLWATPYYFLWKVMSKDKISKFIAKYGKYIFMNTEDLDSIYDIYQKNGWKLTFFGRFLPLGRGFVWLPAWSTKMPFRKFFGYTLAGSLIRVAILVYIWFVLWNDIAQTSSTIKIIEYIVIWVVIIWLISRWLHYFSKRYFKTK